MKRRSFLAAMGLLGLGSVLNGCAAPPNGDVKALNFFNDAASWDPGYRKAGAALSQISGWSLEPRTIPNAFSYEQVVRSLLQTREPPDLIKWGSGYRMRDLARTGALAPLDAEWKASVSQGWLDDGMAADFTYRDHIYGLPLIQGFYVMTYNVGVWRRLGLAKPTTWDGFLTACGRLKDAGITPIATTQQNMWPVANWFSMLSAAFAPDWYGKVCANQASFLDPEPREMLQLWADMIAQGFHTSADSQGDDFPSMLQSGRVGMWPAALSWSSASLIDAGLSSGTGFDAFVLPAVHGGHDAVVTEIAGLIVPEGSPRLDGVRTAMGQWLNPEVQQPWSDFLSGSSANLQVAWSDPVSERLRKEIRDDDVQIVNRYWENSPPPLVVGTMQDLGGFMAGSGDPTSVLESIQRRAETEWSYWAESAS